MTIHVVLYCLYFRTSNTTNFPILITAKGMKEKEANNMILEDQLARFNHLKRINDPNHFACGYVTEEILLKYATTLKYNNHLLFWLLYLNICCGAVLPRVQ